jgi:hypothetical protein
VIVKTSGLADGDLVGPHRLTIQHALLPSGTVVHEARNEVRLTDAHEAFAESFGHLLDTAD